MGRFSPPGYAQGEIVIAGTLAYVGDEAGVHILSLANPARPTPVGMLALPGPANGLELVGQTLFVANGPAGLQIINVALPHAPALLATLDTPGDAQDVVVANQIAYVADGDGGAHLVNVANPVDPVALGAVTTLEALGVALASNLLYVAAGEDGLRLLDVSDPAAPFEVGVIDTPGLAQALLVDGPTVYLADGGGGLRLFDITNPTAPVAASHFLTVGYVTGLALRGEVIYLADAEQGVKAVSVQNRAAPTLVATYNTPGYALNVAAGPHYLLVANESWGLYSLGATFGLGGFVRDIYGNPFAGVTVSAGPVSAVTDASGAYSLTSLLPSRLAVTASHPGYQLWPESQSGSPLDGRPLDFLILAGAVSRLVGPSGGTVVYTDTVGEPNRAHFPAGLMAGPATVWLTPTLVAAPPGSAFANHAFVLAASGESGPITAFAGRVELDIHYIQEDLSRLALEEALFIGYWDGLSWQDAADTCAPRSNYIRQPGANRLRLEVCRPGLFALLEPVRQVYLPIVGE
jgi:hypothetical protein